MNLQATTIKHVIIDECFEPLLQKFYQQQFKPEDFQTLNQELMESSSAKRHEALVGIYHLYLSNRTLLTQMVASGLLFKLIYYLREEQFPQLCFEALRILFFAVENRRIAEHLISTGGVYSLLNLIRKENHRVIVGLSLWTLVKMANHVSGDSINPTITVNQLIELAENEDRAAEADSVIVDVLVKLWVNNVLLRPQDVTRFHSFTLAAIVNVSVMEQTALKGCFQLLSLRMNDTIAGVRAGHWDLLKKTLSNLDDKPVDVIRRYLHFLLIILERVEAITFRQLLITLDVLRVFEQVLTHESEQARLQFCQLVHEILDARGEGPLKYFLSKQSLLIKFYYMIESDTPRTKKQICIIFTSLAMHPSEQVLLLYEEAKIVAIYLRLLREEEDKELLEVCLESLIVVLRYAEKMSLTTFNWFVNFLKTQKIEETCDNLEKLHCEQSGKMKKLNEILGELLIQRTIEESQ